MLWIFRHLPVLLFLSNIEYGTANNQCRTEVNIQGMALKRSVFKRWSVAAPHLCDVKCGQEITCQSYNYNRKYKTCELNNRTKEARPENFLSAPAWFYIRRLNGRAPLGSIPDLPALSCHEIKASEGKDTISGKYWLDPTGTGKAVLIYCDMIKEDMDECKGDKHDCDPNANCTNTYGSYDCACMEGYTGDGHSCADIDECKTNLSSCHVNADCLNTIGSYVCRCHTGYIGNGTTCNADVCQFHTVLEDYDRDVKNRTPPEYVKCDYNLNSGWYRFLNISGITMPTTCPPLYSCSTKFPGWLKGDHPTVDEGEVKRTVCFSEGSGWCCEEASLIWVKNCSSFYVYHLPSLAKCPYRYCFTHN